MRGRSAYSYRPTHASRRIDPPGALRGPLRGAFILASKATRASKQWARRAHCLHLRLTIDLTLKLHAVAPGGPPEGQCDEEQWFITRLPATLSVLYADQSTAGT